MNERGKNRRRRNSDEELRELERAFRSTGAADAAVRLARALLRSGLDRVDTTAFMRRCGVAPVEAHEMVAEAAGVPLVEWKLINYGVTGDEEGGWEINDIHYTGETIQLPADATYSEVHSALADEKIIRSDLEVDAESSSETNVVFRRPSDQRPAGALERASRGNPPLADRDDHRYRYVANCVHAAAEDISAMVESAREITRPYFVRKLAPGEWAEIQRTLGYGRSFPITGDRTISYYRSMFRGQPAVFLEWSAIEYVFTLDGKLGPSAGRDRDALDMRPRSGERGRRSL